MVQGLRLRSAAILVIAGLVAAAPAAGRPPSAPASAELIVGFRAGVPAAQQTAILSPWSGKVRKRWSRIRGALVSVPAGRAAEAQKALERDPRVAFAEPNVVFHALEDPGFGQLWGLQKIQAPAAWGVTTGSSGIVVGVIDSGVDFSHPDLAGAMWVNPGENCGGCRTNGVDDDGNGYVDDWRGWDFANGDNNPADDNGHGTHVAGTIGAVGDNGIGVTGVNKHVSVMGLKFIGADGTGTAADAISALLYASAMGASVTNNSYGGDGFSEAMLDAIRTADARDSLFVVAAGNDGSDNDAAPVYPASYDVPNVVAVAASDQADNPAFFSNYGVGSVDLAAPGWNIFSTWPGGGYRFDSGTSMAAPHVAGAAALAKAAFPFATDLGLKAMLLRSVDRVTSLDGVVRTGGRLNVSNAVRCADRPRVFVDSPAPGFETRAEEALPISVLATRCGEVGSLSVEVTVNGLPVSLTQRADGLYTGTFTPLAAEGLTVRATGSTPGGADTDEVTGEVVQFHGIEPGGDPVTVTTTAPGQNAMLSFYGEAGRRIAMKVSDVSVGSSPCCSLWISMNGAGGPLWLNPMPFGRNGGFMDTKTLPQSGYYQIIVDPAGNDFGSLTLTLYDVPPDVTAPISPGGAPVTVTTGPVPGQNAVLSFLGLAGQRVSLKVSGSTIGTSPCCAAYVSMPGVAPGALFGKNGLFVDTKTLPATGLYSVVVDPLGMELGSATVSLYDVPADTTTPMTVGGPPMTVSAGAVPGQNAVMTFEGVAGQRVLLKASGVTVGTSTCCSLNLSVPGVTTPVLMGRNGGLVDAFKLPRTGTFSVLVDPVGIDAGSVTLQALAVPEDVTGTISPGAPVTVTTTAPGQNAALTFAGVAGQRVSLKMSGVAIGTSTCCSSKVGILNPNGSSLVGGTLFGTNGGFLDTKVLPATGIYTVVVDPQGLDVGSATATLYEVPPDVTGTLTVGGPPVNATLGTPGQNAVLTFQGTAGQRVTVRASNVTIGPSTCCSFVLSVKRSDGLTIATAMLGTNGGSVNAVIPATGSYSLTIDPQGAGHGGVSAAAS